MLTIDHLQASYGKVQTLWDISFEVPRGEIVALVGANGAGKTTAMKILCGLSSPTSGEVTVGGFDIYTQTEKVKRNIGYMSQKFSLYEDMTIAENIRFFSGIYGISPKDRKARQEVLLRNLGLEASKDTLIGSLPLGWKQKLAFSVAIFHEPKIVFLDEPTGGVDPITRRKFWDLIYEAADRGITVFVTTHYMDEAEYCNRVSIMNNGKIEALDTPDNLKKQYSAKNIDEVFLKIARNVD